MTRDPPAAIDDRPGPRPDPRQDHAGWQAHLRLHFHRRGDATVCLHAHEGPLRVLKSMHPEGAAVCHQVIVHPPGGIVGGDVLRIDIDAAANAHAVLTTPGATRFYRSAGAQASQSVDATLHAGSRLEWLPLETIVHNGARAANRALFRLEPGASMIGWDITCLGLPASGEGFRAGRLTQHLEIDGRWLDRGTIDAADERLLKSPLGLDGRCVIGTAWVAWEASVSSASSLLDDAREGLRGLEPAADRRARPVIAAATELQPGLIVVRALADRVEPVNAAFRTLRKAWRCALWGVGPSEPRVWGA